MGFKVTGFRDGPLGNEAGGQDHQGGEQGDGWDKG